VQQRRLKWHLRPEGRFCKVSRLVRLAVQAGLRFQEPRTLRKRGIACNLRACKIMTTEPLPSLPFAKSSMLRVMVMAPGHGRQGRWRVWVRAGSATPRLYLDASFVINTAPMFIVRGLGDSLNGRRAAEAGEVECLQSSRDRLSIRAEVHHFYLGSHSPIQDVLTREYVGGEGSSRTVKSHRYSERAMRMTHMSGQGQRSWGERAFETRSLPNEDHEDCPCVEDKDEKTRTFCRSVRQ
jgi:hypothetical protein